MLLLVVLANIIMNRVRLSDGSDGSSIPAAMEKNKGETDPLADIGVAPSTSPSDPDKAGTKGR